MGKYSQRFQIFITLVAVMSSNAAFGAMFGLIGGDDTVDIKTLGIVILSGSKKCHGKESPNFKAMAKQHGPAYTPDDITVFSNYKECFEADGTLSGNIKDPTVLAAYADYKKKKADQEQCVDAVGIVPANCDKKTELVEESLNAENKLEEAEKEKVKEEKFAGFRMGIAVAPVNFTTDIIYDVSINGTTVQVNEIRDKDVSLMLETHSFLYTKTTNSGTFGFGPFFAAGLASTSGSDPLSTFGVGLIGGTRKAGEDSGFNMGFGYYLKKDAEKLRIGVVDGKTTSYTDPKDLTVKQDVGGFMLIFSSTW